MKKIKYLIFEKLASTQIKRREKYQLKKEDIKSVLLIRQDNRIGNIIFITSLINLIEKELNVKPDVILGEKFNGILKNNPHINKLLVYSQKKFLKNPILFFKFIKTMKEKQYDLIIDCKNAFSFNNSLITLLANGKVKIGFENIYSNKYLDYAVDGRELVNLHESEYLAAPFLKYFKIDSPVPEMNYYLNNDKIQITKNPESKNKKQIGIHIGGRGQKSLDIEIINDILEKFTNYDVKIIYGPDEIEKLKFIKDKENIERIFPKTIDDLAVLINTLDVFITPDTGPLHVASALNKNIIALFTGDTFQRYGPRTSKKSLCIDVSTESKEITINKIAEFISSI